MKKEIIPQDKCNVCSTISVPKRMFDATFKCKVTADSENVFSHYLLHQRAQTLEGEWGGGSVSSDPLSCVSLLFLCLSTLMSTGKQEKEGGRRLREFLSLTSQTWVCWGSALACCHISELNGRLCPEHTRMWLKRRDEEGNGFLTQWHVDSPHTALCRYWWMNLKLILYWKDSSCHWMLCHTLFEFFADMKKMSPPAQLNSDAPF